MAISGHRPIQTVYYALFNYMTLLMGMGAA